MADPVRSTTPAAGIGGFAGRAGGHAIPRRPTRDGKGPSARDPGGAAMPPEPDSVLRLLRERVLAGTRIRLGVDGGHAPEFAEVLEGEPVPAFLGRLLSAQNQLAARRAPHLPAETLRALCDEALQAGVAETLELLAADPHADPGAAVVVAAVLAEHERRVRALPGATGSASRPIPPDPA